MFAEQMLRTFVPAALCSALLLVAAPAAQAVPVLYLQVDGGSEVSLEDGTVCEGTAPVTCFGTGGEGDLFVSSFELTADPSAYLAGSFNFYNASSTDTISVVATILFPMTGAFSAPSLGVGTGFVNNVFGGGIFNITVEGLVDPPGAALLADGPFSVCEDVGFDPACDAENPGGSSSLFGSGPGSLNVLSAIGLRISFDLTADTTATIGFDPAEPYNGSAFFSITPTSVVPVPAAAWLFLSALGATAALRRRTIHRGSPHD